MLLIGCNEDLTAKSWPGSRECNFQAERMNQTLKETLNKLALETGTDWVTLLSFALYRVRNSPYQLGLTPFEIMYGISTPITPNLQSEAIAELEDDELIIRVRATQWAHMYICPKLQTPLSMKQTQFCTHTSFIQETGSM